MLYYINNNALGHLNVVLICILYKFILVCSQSEDINNEVYFKHLQMPDAKPTKNDDYLCTAMALNSSVEEWIIMYDPVVPTNRRKRVHHMLLYGCSSVPKERLGHVWDCGHHGVCAGSRIMFAWAKNAPGINLPEDVGFRIGKNTSIKYLALQIHYSKHLPEIIDNSGLKITLTRKSQRYKAGIYLLARGYGVIPASTPSTSLDVNCKLKNTEPEPINVFAFRTHAHSLGSVITGYVYNPQNESLTELVRWNPQWPQAFYPLPSVRKISRENFIHARCTYNSLIRNTTTHIGSNSQDEMCNLYLMYFTDREKGSETGLCNKVSNKAIISMLPATSSKPLPPNVMLELISKNDIVNKNDKITYGTNKNSKTANNTEVLNGHVADKIKSEVTSEKFVIRMPNVRPKVADDYICTAVRLNSSEQMWVTLFKPLASARRVHHMLLYGCSGIYKKSENGSWDCGHHGVCKDNKVMFAWAKNAPATHLPDDVGFRIGKNTDVRYLVMQIHYVNPLPEGVTDDSGLEMTVSNTPQKYMAGIYVLVGVFADIPPRTSKTHIDINCQIKNTETSPIKIFAYRTHAHKLGTVISGYKLDAKSNQLSEVAKGNPQWPQAFYPMNKPQDVQLDDILHARCTYDSTNKTTHTYIGSTSSYEMCNLYLMYYTNTKRGVAFGECLSETFPAVTKMLPTTSDQPLPPNPLLEHIAHGQNLNKEIEITYTNNRKSSLPMEVKKKAPIIERPQDPGPYNQPRPGPVQPVDEFSLPIESRPIQHYQNEKDPRYMEQNAVNTQTKETIRPSKQGSGTDFYVVSKWGPVEKLGQVSGVAVDSRGDVVIFHRGSVKWDFRSFLINEVLANQQNPIEQPTLLHLYKENGTVMHRWGQNMFFMPHGLTIDKEDNIWLTDVGLHQVFKFPKEFGDGKPLLTLGMRFEPGSDTSHFCKPTDVAVLENGEFFVSDGYCNSRILHFSPEGKFIKQMGSPSTYSSNPAPVGLFKIPHALTIVKESNQVCAADRENGRIQCLNIDSGEFVNAMQFGSCCQRIFSCVYSSALGNKLLFVNGPGLRKGQTLQVYEVGFSSGQVLHSFSPDNQGLNNPHDLAISNDGRAIYVAEIGPNKIWKFMMNASYLPEENTSVVDSGIDIDGAKTEQLKLDSRNTLNLFTSGYSSITISTLVLGLVSIPAFVLLTLVVVLRCRKRAGRLKYLRNEGKLMNVLNGGRKGVQGLKLGSLLNGRHHGGGFERISTNDIDDQDYFDSAESDVEEFSVTSTKCKL